MPAATLAAPAIRIDCLLDGDDGSMADDVREGLARPLKELKPKYFYDARGCELFDRITEQPEYYPTRCERLILNRHAPVIVALAESQELVELGSGSASKTRALLYAMAGAGTLRRYVPVDVSEVVVERSAIELTDSYPGLRVHGLVCDFERHLDRIPEGEGPRLVAFLGGTIGNLYPPERARMLAEIRAILRPEDRLLLGTDLVKERDVLEAAYNDSQGVTAEFNRNVLNAVNDTLAGDFDVEAFDHVAFFDADNSWIEMRLRSRTRQRVRLEALDMEVEFDECEEMRTEISTKFTREALEEEMRAAGMDLEAFFTDPDGLFALSLAAPA